MKMIVNIGKTRYTFFKPVVNNPILLNLLFKNSGIVIRQKI